MNQAGQSNLDVCDWSYRMIVAEDCPDTQIILRVRLGTIATELACTDNGKDCLEIVRRAWRRGEPFDLVLLDLLMPGLDGFAVTTALRAEGYTWPILIMSARHLVDDRKQALQAGCDEYLSKDFLQNRFSRPGRRTFDVMSPPQQSGPGLMQSEAELIRHFVGRMPGTLSRLQAAIEMRDWHKLELLAAHLKASLLFGLPKLSELAQRLQTGAKATSGEQCRHACDGIRACFEMVQAAVM